MVLASAIVLGFVAAWMLAAAVLMHGRGIRFRQALLYLPLKLIYRIKDDALRQARDAEAPVIYVISHQSRLEPALMLSLLPDQTLHILDDASAKAFWLTGIITGWVGVALMVIVIGFWIVVTIAAVGSAANYSS